MSATGLSIFGGAIGTTGFAFLTWGSIALVTIAFGYVVWTLLTGRHSS